MTRHFEQQNTDNDFDMIDFIFIPMTGIEWKVSCSKSYENEFDLSQNVFF